MHTVKWFQILLCITNNSIKHQSFVYKQLNDQTVLFLTIQLNISHLFAPSLNVKQFYLIYRFVIYQVLSLQVRVDLGVMAIKGYSVSPKLQDWNLTIRWFNVISRTIVEGGGSYPSAEWQLVYSVTPAVWAAPVMS